MLPLVYQDHGQDGQKLRQSVGAGEQGHALQAVDHQHHHDGRRQHPPQIQNGCRGLLPEEQEGQEADQGRDGTGNQNEQRMK